MSRPYSIERAAILAAILARVNPSLGPFQIAQNVMHLQRIGRQAETIAVNLCNLPDYQETFDKRMKGLRRRAGDICERLSVPCVHGNIWAALGGDPRGYCLKLHIPGMAGDGFGGVDDGLPVY